MITTVVLLSCDLCRTEIERDRYASPPDVLAVARHVGQVMASGLVPADWVLYDLIAPVPVCIQVCPRCTATYPDPVAEYLRRQEVSVR
jgi:hypothetical protein